MFTRSKRDLFYSVMFIFISPFYFVLLDVEPVIVEVSSGIMISESSNLDYLALKDEGNALYAAGDFIGAVQKYSKGLKLCADNNTDRTTLLKNRAAAYLYLWQYQKVIEDTTAALEITPNDIKALYRRCQAYEHLGKFNEAFEDAKSVNRLNPQNSAIQPYLRRLQEIKPVIVEEVSGTALSEISNWDYLALKDEGNALYSAGDFPSAVQRYSKCLDLCMDKNTDRSTLLKNRAAAYLNLQEYQKVVEDTTTALEITPSDIKALYRRCQAYEQLGKYNEAFEDAQAVNRLNPQNSAIQPYLRRLQEIVEESNDDVLDINSFPEEIILKIFGYLTQNQLGQIARVCRRWAVLTRIPVLWKKVNVEFLPSHVSQTNVMKCFVNKLPRCVTCIRLWFKFRQIWSEPLNFKELSMRLQDRCPHLEKLILDTAILSDNLSSIVDLCTEFLQDVKCLVLHHCRLHYCPATEECGSSTSKIEVLDLSCSRLLCFNKPSFSRMPFLKSVCLAYTDVNDSWFEDETSLLNQLHVLDLGETWITSRTCQEIRNCGLNLKELYLCHNRYLKDDDLNFNNAIFPHLKSVCLKGYCNVTCDAIVSLIQSCPSLQDVYVHGYVALLYEKHPFVIANKCKLEVVKCIDCEDHEQLHYPHEY